MQRLKQYYKKESLRKKILIGVYAFLIIGIILTSVSYAVYQQETKVTFINARVGEFKANDIELAMKVDGEEVSAPPSKDNYSVTVSCDNADGVWNMEEWGADIRNITSNRVKCEVNFVTQKPTLSEIKVTPTKTSISLSYEVEGVNVRTVCKYGTEEGIYPNEVEGVTNTNCNIKGLENDTTYYYQVCAINNGGEDCKVGSKKTATLADLVELGDYISMTPTSTSYTPPSNLTGCLNDSNCTQNTLNPSELNLWRVIKKNEDGTVDVVSEYVSSKTARFYAYTGFINLVVGLNTIAAQYTDGVHVEKTRHLGYSNQTDVITNTSKIYSSNDPWTKSTSQLYGFVPCDTNTFLCGVDESLGAGDIGYETDYNLVNEVYGTMIAFSPNDLSTGKPYFLSGRFYYYGGKGYHNFSSHSIVSDGTLANGWMVTTLPGYKSEGTNLSVRPVVTLKSTVEIKSGDGKSKDTAYQLL